MLRQDRRDGGNGAHSAQGLCPMRASERSVPSHANGTRDGNREAIPRHRGVRSGSGFGKPLIGPTRIMGSESDCRKHEQRGGKASAANFGTNYSKGKYVVHLDADSSLDRDAIEKILLPFYYDPKIKAVGGCVKVRNADASLCSSMQALEYLKTIQVGRMVTSELGIYHIISGFASHTCILKPVLLGYTKHLHPYQVRGLLTCRCTQLHR